MTEQQIEKDADEAWALWRREMKAAGRLADSLPQIEVWQHAYRMGMSLGAEIGRAGGDYPPADFEAVS